MTTNILKDSTVQWKTMNQIGMALWYTSLNDISNGTHHVLIPSRPPHFLWQKLGVEAWERG